MESDRITNKSNPFAQDDSEELAKILEKLIIKKQKKKEEKIKEIKEKIDNF